MASANAFLASGRAALQRKGSPLSLSPSRPMGAGDFEVLARYSSPDTRSTSLIFLFTGEGAHVVAAAQTPTAGELCKLGDSSSNVEAALAHAGLPSLDALLTTALGQHTAPLSPVVTTVLNLLNAHRWQAAGHVPSIAVGHSIGEVAAAHVSGLLSVADAIRLAHGLGRIGARLTGGMLHTRVSRRELVYMRAVAVARSAWAPAQPWEDELLSIAAINDAPPAGTTNASSPGARDVGVSLCGAHEQVQAWLDTDPNSERLPPLHPWHHPAYAQLPDVTTALDCLPRGPPGASSTHGRVVFVSACRPEVVQSLDATYWLQWLSQPGEARYERPAACADHRPRDCSCLAAHTRICACICGPRA